MPITITKHIDFDAGHRVPDHLSKCRSPHGHRYRVEATVSGPVLDAGPENGMVLDFGHLKTLLVELVHEPFDHAMLVYAGDGPMRLAMEADDTWKVCVLPCVPTAENLADLIAVGRLNWTGLAERVRDWNPNLDLVKLTVWETPTCSAIWTP